MTGDTTLVHRFLVGDGAVGVVAAAARRGRAGYKRLFFGMVARSTGDAVSFDMRFVVEGDGKVAAGRLGRVVKGNPIRAELD
jgi:hypothetical protein